MLAFRPYDMCRFFGMDKYMVRFDVMPANVYPLTALAMGVQLLLVVLSSVLAMGNKLNKLAVFFSGFAFPALFIMQGLSEFFDEWSFRESTLAMVNYKCFNSVCRFWLVIILSGVALSLISALLAGKSNPRTLSVLSNISLTVFLLSTLFNGLTEKEKTDYFFFLVLPYMLTAVMFIVLNVMTISGKTGYKAGITAIVFTALFPLSLHLSNMFLSGDYYGLMSLNSQRGYADVFLTLWYLGGCFSAVSIMKGVYAHDNSENC